MLVPLMCAEVKDISQLAYFFFHPQKTAYCGSVHAVLAKQSDLQKKKKKSGLLLFRAFGIASNCSVQKETSKTCITYDLFPVPVTIVLFLHYVMIISIMYRVVIYNHILRLTKIR